MVFYLCDEHAEDWNAKHPDDPVVLTARKKGKGYYKTTKP